MFLVTPSQMCMAKSQDEIQDTFGKNKVRHTEDENVLYLHFKLNNSVCVQLYKSHGLRLRNAYITDTPNSDTNKI